MTVLAAWSVGMAVLVWLGEEHRAWIPVLGVVPALWLPERWDVMAAALFSGLLSWNGLKKGSGPAERDIRQSLARFWQQVSVLLTAGLTFWQAVETSVESEPLIRSAIANAADSLMRRSRTELAISGLPKEDGALTLLLLQHGHLHGLGAGQIQSHVRHLEARLKYEDEVKKRRDPIWMTVLPALLLLNVLWVFLAPMVALAGHSWFKL